MPAFAVKVKVAGPFRDASDGKKFAGAYSHRFVFASNAHDAEERAVEGVKSEPRFAQLKLIEGIGPPLTEVDEVRRASWYEGLFSNAALVFYEERTGQN
jgi:hypothetical protein